MEENNLEIPGANEEITGVDNTEKDNAAAETKENVEKTFTQEDIDRIISRTIARERKKAEEEKTEAEKLAKMSAEEKAKHEFEKEKAKFEEERQAYLKEKLELQVTKELASKNLPTEFSKYLVAGDADKSLENIKEFESLFNNALEKHINEKLKGKTPAIGGQNTATGPTKEQFKKMSLAEQSNLFNTNRELYDSLIK